MTKQHTAFTLILYTSGGKLRHLHENIQSLPLVACSQVSASSLRLVYQRLRTGGEFSCTDHAHATEWGVADDAERNLIWQ